MYMNNFPYVVSVLAAVAEWISCMIFWRSAPKRFREIPTAVLMAMALLGQLLLHIPRKRIPLFVKPGDTSGAGLLFSTAVVILINTFFMLCGTILVTRYSLRNAAYIAAKVLVIAEFMASAGCVMCELWNVMGYTVGSAACFTGYGSMYVAITIMTIRIERTEHKYLASISVSRWQCLMAILTAIIAFFISNAGMVTMEFHLQGMQFNRLILRLLGDACGYTLLWLMIKSRNESEIALELAAVKNTLDLQYQQYLTFRDTSQYIARQSHDLKHQLDALKYSTSQEEQASYVQEMERMLELNDAWHMTGNSVLDSILTQKKLYCVERDIEFVCLTDEVQIDSLPARDISSLLGNILDNAIEAVLDFKEPDKRVIRGDIKMRNGFLVFVFENYYEGPPLAGDMLPSTTKTDPALHGYGLKSIRYVAEKYGGSMKLKAANNWFSICVVLSVAEKMLGDTQKK